MSNLKQDIFNVGQRLKEFKDEYKFLTGEDVIEDKESISFDLNMSLAKYTKIMLELRGISLLVNKLDTDYKLELAAINEFDNLGEEKTYNILLIKIQDLSGEVVILENAVNDIINLINGFINNKPPTVINNIKKSEHNKWDHPLFRHYTRVK